MTQESGKHVRRGLAPAATPPRVSNLPGTRTLGLLAALLLLGAGVLWVIWAPWSDDGSDAAGPSKPVTRTGAATYGAEWTTADDGHFRITVTPTGVSERASVASCVPAPATGRVNARFSMRVENLGEQDSPAPRVEVGTNLGQRGTIRTALLSLDRSSRSLELAPLPSGGACGSAAEIGPAGRDPIRPGTALTLRGTVGPVVRDGSGLALIVRYHQADPAAPGGSTAQEFLVPLSLVAG